MKFKQPKAASRAREKERKKYYCKVSLVLPLLLLVSFVKSPVVVVVVVVPVYEHELILGQCSGGNGERVFHCQAGCLVANSARAGLLLIQFMDFSLFSASS